MWKNLNPHTLLVGMLNGATVTKNRLAAQQLKQLLYDPAILLLDIDPKGKKLPMYLGRAKEKRKKSQKNRDRTCTSGRDL